MRRTAELQGASACSWQRFLAAMICSPGDVSKFCSVMGEERRKWGKREQEEHKGKMCL